MVQIIENHANIAGTLLSVQDAADRPGFVSMKVKVKSASPVDNFPNLFEQHVGQDVEVLAPRGSIAATQTPGPVQLRVKRGGPTTIFAE